MARTTKPVFEQREGRSAVREANDPVNVKVAVPFVTAYGPKMEVLTEVGEVDMTRQSCKDECDINQIMSQFRKTGIATHVALYQGEYGEFTDMDFHEAMNTVIAAEEMFETVPAEIRERFGNDPGKFLEFVSDDANRAEMEEIGLISGVPGDVASGSSPGGPRGGEPDGGSSEAGAASGPDT